MLARMPIQIKSARMNAVLCQIHGCGAGADYVVCEEATPGSAQKAVVTAYCAKHAENLATQNGWNWNALTNFAAVNQECRPRSSRCRLVDVPDLEFQQVHQSWLCRPGEKLRDLLFAHGWKYSSRKRAFRLI